jgi:hypothetical protein
MQINCKKYHLKHDFFNSFQSWSWLKGERYDLVRLLPPELETRSAQNLNWTRNANCL